MSYLYIRAIPMGDIMICRIYQVARLKTVIPLNNPVIAPKTGNLLKCLVVLL